MVRKIKHIVIIALVSSGWLTTTAHAGKRDSLSYTGHKEFILDWDNDMFVFTDYYYTQGAHIGYVHPVFRKNPANHILFRLKSADNYYGLSGIQQIFTPKDITDSLLNVVDRPYAGTLFLRSFVVSSRPDLKLRLTNQLDIGFLGPLSGAEQAQMYVHKWLGLRWPNGWDFQIDNRPYLNYNSQLEKGFDLVPGVFELTGSSRLRVGNIYDDLRLGASFRLGRINDSFKGLGLPNLKYNENKHFQWFVFGGAHAMGVLYNATLMGGLVPPKSQHSFEFRQIRNFVTSLEGGVQLIFRDFGAKGSVIWKSPEFVGGYHHHWGNITVYLRF